MLNPGKLTDWQWALAERSTAFLVILHNTIDKRTARALETKGWGTVEPGAFGETIFRLNQAGCDAMASA